MAKRGGYAPLTQLGAAGSPSGRARSRPLVRTEVDEGGYDEAEGYVGNPLCMPAGKAVRTDWTWVGQGKGRYLQSQHYAFVGEGRGDFEPQPRPRWAWPRSWCCPCATALAVVALLAYAAAEPQKWAALRFDRPELTWLPGMAASRAEEPYFCTLPGAASRGLAVGVAGGDAPVGSLVDERALVERWSADKRDWCCRNAGVGCSFSFNCEAGYENWERGWSPAKQGWCCRQLGKGCPREDDRRPGLPYDCGSELDSWRTSWSESKKAWCCQNAHQGCDESLGSFDCSEGLSDWQAEWPPEKRRFCCQHAGRGCPATSALTFDCQAGLSNAAVGWSEEKKRWCCGRTGRGCAEGAGGDGGEEAVPAACRPSPGEAPGSATRAWCCKSFRRMCEHQSVPFDCSAGWDEAWPADQQEWCCLHSRAGCPPGLRSFDCRERPHEPAAAWAPERRSYCCRQRGVGCGTASGDVDCSGDAASWGQQQREWCCRRQPERCAAPRGPSADAGGYDCRSAPERWPLDQARWCCRQHGVGCHTGAAYDCLAGYDHWRQGWSDAKKSWCCERHRVGCPDPDLYDCDAGLSSWAEGWSAEKKAWCCDRHGKGCEAPARAPADFDCDEGLSNWEKGWSPEKKSWCCRRASRGCAPTAPPYDCQRDRDTWERSWTAAKKVYCCREGGVGCGSPAPLLSCPLNCFGGGAEAVVLHGAEGEGDGAAVKGLSADECRKRCIGTNGCEGVLYTNGTAASSAGTRSLCYGKKHFHISKCQPGEPGLVTEVMNVAMPWGQCAIVGDPHIITFDRVFGKPLLQTDPGDYWLVRSQPLQILGRFGFTDRFPTASSATGVAVAGSAIQDHRLTVEYVGPAQGYAGFKVLWDGQAILGDLPSSYRSPDGLLSARLDYMDPSKFHREGRHTIGGTEGNLPSYLFDLGQDLSVYVLVGPDNCNIVVTARKVAGGQDGYCGDFDCDPENDSFQHLLSRGISAPVPLAQSLFSDPPKAPRAIGAALHGGPAQD